MEQRSEEWFTARRTRLTASDVASVIGRNSFKNSMDVLLEKLGLQNQFQGNEATQHGQLYEDEAISIYESQTGRRVLRPGLEYHKSIPGVAGSPDGITECGVLIEVKVRTLVVTYLVPVAGLVAAFVGSLGVPTVVRRLWFSEEVFFE